MIGSVVDSNSLYEPRYEKTGSLHNKGADQLRGNRAADQRLCFHFIDSTTPLHPKFQAFSHILCLYSLVKVGPGWDPKLMWHILKFKASSYLLQLLRLVSALPGWKALTGLFVNDYSSILDCSKLRTFTVSDFMHDYVPKQYQCQ